MDYLFYIYQEDLIMHHGVITNACMSVSPCTAEMTWFLTHCKR